MSDRQATVRAVLDRVKTDGRTSLTAPECKEVCDAYAIPLPKEGLATSAEDAASIAAGIGYPVVMKIVSADILHKTEAGGVLVGVADDAAAKAGFDSIMANAKAYKADADLTGVQIQQMVSSDGQEVIVGAVTDPSFGKLVAFGLGGILVDRDHVQLRLRNEFFDQAAVVQAQHQCIAFRLCGSFQNRVGSLGPDFITCQRLGLGLVGTDLARWRLAECVNLAFQSDHE